jgi:hypothetical protein
MSGNNLTPTNRDSNGLVDGPKLLPNAALIPNIYPVSDFILRGRELSQYNSQKISKGFKWE